MNHFIVALHIVPRRGLLDPQGKAVAGALHALGFTSVADVHVGRHIIVELAARSAEEAEREARTMCERLLANPITEDFEVASVSPRPAGGDGSRSAAGKPEGASRRAEATP